MKIPGVPGYFFKVHPDGQHISYIYRDQNYLLDIETGTSHAIPGYVDPVWSPDAEFLITPGPHQGGDLLSSQNMALHKGSQILKLASQDKALQSPSTLVPIQGVYQSVGKDEQGKYSVVTDYEGLSLYEVSSNGLSTKNLGNPCSAITHHTDLPMISKDKKYLSLLEKGSDGKGKKTLIFNIENGCSLAMELPFPTGKVSFNHDSSQISFHIDQMGEFQDGYFSGIGKDMIKNTVVMNLNASQNGKILTPASYAMASGHTTPGDGAYYPDFDRHGKLIFIEDVGNNFQFVKLDPKKLKFRPYHDWLFKEANNEECPLLPETQSLRALGELWSALCENDLLRERPILVDAMDGDACASLVNEHWSKSLGVSKEVLLKSCPSPRTHPVTIGQWSANTHKAEDILAGKCLSCHQNEIRFDGEISVMVYDGKNFKGRQEKVKKIIPPLNLNGIDGKVMKSMLKAISEKRMPKGNPLDKQEMEIVSDYLEKKSLEVSTEDDDETIIIHQLPVNKVQEKYAQTLKDDPNMSPEDSNTLKIAYECLYGQQNCFSYFLNVRMDAEEEAKNMPEGERKKFVEDKVLEEKCSVLQQVTIQECYDFKIRSKKK